MSDFHKRLKRVKRKGKLRTADLARWFQRPYTTVDSWLKRGCVPNGENHEPVLRALANLENKIKRDYEKWWRLRHDMDPR